MRRFLKFGGWFSLESKEAKRRSVLFRFKIHLRRIAADGLKVLLLLLVVYFGSMPFWPLAVPPVSPELKARYAPPEYHPRGHGEAERMWQAIFPEPEGIYTNVPPEQAAAPLYQLKELLSTNDVDAQWACGGRADVCRLLDRVEPELHAWAATCAAEDPPVVPPRADGYEEFSSFDIAVYKALFLAAGRRAEEGDAGGVLECVDTMAGVGAYFTRGNTLWGWLVGGLVPSYMVRSAVGLQVRGLVDTDGARRFGHIFDEYDETSGTIVPAIVRETMSNQRLLKAYWNKEPQFETHAAMQASMTGTRSHGWQSCEWMDVRNWSWLFGSFGRDCMAISRRVGDRLIIEAGVWSDPRVVPGDVLGPELWSFCFEPRPWFRRGRFALTLMPRLERFYRRGYFVTGAELLIGKAVAAIGAHQRGHGELPPSLDAALAPLGDDYRLKTRYVQSPVEFCRLDGGEPGDTNAYAFAVTVWGDGKRCTPNGGVSWLVCRNPAFGGECPVRCWEWVCFDDDSPPDTVLSRRAEWIGSPAGLSHQERSAFSERPHRTLQVPATLLSDDKDVWFDAERLMRAFGWRDQSVPPRLGQ